MRFKSLILAALLALLTLTLLPALPAELRQIPLDQDEALLTGKLPNGLTYYIMRNSQPANIAEMRLLVNVGSVNEDDDQRGLAHFTEHMAFNGTKNFDRTGVVSYLSSIGMGYYNGLNGMTSYDFTAYTFKIPTNDQAKLRQGMLILSDMAYQLSFDPVEIERERGVIIEEWRMGQDASSRIRDRQNAVFLAGSRYAERSPIGTYDVLSTFQPETLKRFYRDWYRPDMQSVVIVGDFEPAAMLALVEEYFGPIPPAVDPRPRENFFVADNLAPQAVVALDPEYPNNLMTIYWKKPVQTVRTLGDSYEELKRNIFYTMLNSRLDEHSKKPNPPFSFSASFEYPLLRTMSTAAVYSFFTAGKAEEALNTILTETERVQRYGFLPSEFERAKIELLRGAEREVAAQQTRESEDIAWSLFDAIANENVFLSPTQDYELIQALIEFISLEEVNAIVADLIPEKNMFIGLSGPSKAGLEYPSEARLLEIARNTAALELEAYEDKGLDEPLLNSIPQPKPIRKERRETGADLRVWELANGAKVYLKKTDFKNDEVLLSAMSPGGFTLLPVADVSAASLLGGYLEDSGFGNFDGVSLRKATAGKVASASLSVDQNSESISASCSPKDMELMFQLIHQYATNPRFDEADFASYIQRTKSYYQNRNLEPMNVFIDRMISSLYQNNPYRRNLGETDFDSIALADLERIFRDRFADFSDFSFVIVGNFDEALLKTYCETYLANLPSLKLREKVRDVGIRQAQGLNEICFRKGSSDRSFVAHFNSTKYQRSIGNSVLINALAHILNEKMRENIRENLSGVYFIQSWPVITNFPKPQIAFGTMMACSPSRVEELNAAIFATLDSLQAGQIDERYLVAARATLEQQYTQNIKTNNFWSDNIQTSIWLKRPLSEFLREPEFYGKIDLRNIARTAKKYLDYSRNRLSVIMLPEIQEN